ncbi:hypothetical protein [Magnetofaba australis]|uniref:Putative guanylate kinase/L-type calcium channel region n=1 Tax=Magnetofaba australis IT-1 TaxID=1434232 RepID=A0A1Y2K2S7_9PROT|nr:hypothetical protein [Magnetofaba australis]OSM02330.1 putative guanylate kinase/L-type calcium channel region [Magnetofaba australis IT-1]
MGRLILLSGPSCVGKGPLMTALRQYEPDLAGRLRQVVIYNQRAPRPGERDGVHYHFRPRARIAEIGQQAEHLLFEARGDLQCLAFADIDRAMQEGHDAFLEANPEMVAQLDEQGVLARHETLSVFLSPLNRAEIEQARAAGLDLDRLVADVQRRKLLKRTTRFKTRLGLPDLEDIERRCTRACREMRLAWRFDWVIPCHDGEEHDNWDAFPLLLGDAARALNCYATLLRSQTCAWAERWPQELIPAQGDAALQR